MSTLSFVIRDGHPTDISSCLTLDRSYETEYVWQMVVQEGTGGVGITFRKERLPRRMEVEPPVSERRIKSVLAEKSCFIVATVKDEPETLGYLAMSADHVHRLALAYELVVSRPYRRKRVGTRLLNVARQWAEEHHLSQLLVETQTKNYPSIEFLQASGLSFCGYNDQYFPNQDIALFFGQALR